MRGRSIPNSRQSSASERLFVSAIGAGQKNGSIAQIRPTDHLFDAVQQDGARCLEQHLLIIGVELPDGEAAPGRNTAEGIGEPVGQGGKVVEGEEIAVVGRNHQLALLAREPPHGGDIGVDQRLEQLREDGLGRALLAGYRQNGIGTA